MSKFLIAGGDSFTFGSELPDATDTIHSNLTWSALLAKHKGLEYKCVAKPGAGNSAIMRRVIEAVEITEEKPFVAVMWSWPGRLEIKIDNIVKGYKLRQMLPKDDIENGWLNISPWNAMSFDERIVLLPAKDDAHFVKIYKRQCELEKQVGMDILAESYFTLASNEHFLYQSAMAIFTLQCYLEKKDIDYVFATTTDHLLEMFSKEDIPFLSMIDKSKWINLDQGMYQWALEKKYEISPMNHPVAKAHEDWLNLHYKG
jgi:hypothetical protein